MSWDKRCDNCVHSRPDCMNVNNSDHFCDNEESEEYGYNVEYIFGCECWEGAERLPAAICWATQRPPEECPRGLDQCEGEECDEYFIAYGV